MILFNTLTIADIVSKKEGLERVVLIGQHLSVPQLEQMAEMSFKYNSKKNIHFVRYASFLSSFGLLCQFGL